MTEVTINMKYHLLFRFTNNQLETQGQPNSVFSFNIHGSLIHHSGEKKPGCMYVLLYGENKKKSLIFIIALIPMSELMGILHFFKDVALWM